MVELNETLYDLNRTYAVEFGSTTKGGAKNKQINPWFVSGMKKKSEPAVVSGREKESEPTRNIDSGNVGIPEIKFNTRHYSHLVETNVSIDRNVTPTPINNVTPIPTNNVIPTPINNVVIYQFPRQSHLNEEKIDFTWNMTITMIWKSQGPELISIRI